MDSNLVSDLVPLLRKSPDKPSVGVIGLGIMGSQYAKHLIAAGFEVAGCDTSSERLDELLATGGRPIKSAVELVERSAVVIIALSSIAAFQDVVLGAESIAKVARGGQVFVEMGTLPIALKEQARQLLVQHGADMIDAPVTGTRIHAERKELVVYASGAESVVARIFPVLEAFARDVRYVGPFGAGMKLKMVTNHLVAIHNVAAAETLSLAAQAGLDLQMVYDLIAGGPASSAVFGFRAPLMIQARYEPPTMRMDVFEKDLQLIQEFATSLHAAAPLFEASLGVYRAALSQGMKAQDVAATFEVMRNRSIPALTPTSSPASEIRSRGL